MGRIACLASKCECASAFSFRDMTFFMICFSNFSENVDLINSTKFDFHSPVVGYCQGNLRVCKIYLQMFPDMTFFFLKFSEKFQKEII